MSDGSTSRRAAWPSWAWAVAVFAVALGVFARGVKNEKTFMDEYAYISQSFYADLLLGGAFDAPEWLEFSALDHPPLVKYLIGLSLRAGGHPRPGLSDANAWYRDQSWRFGTAESLAAARRPSVILGALGCALLYGIGVMACGRCAGVLAALLLMIDPLYRMHARRAMCDVPTEALVLATVAAALWSWRRTLAGDRRFAACLGMALATGGLGGLAVLAKLNGALGLMILAALALLALTLPNVKMRRAAVAVAGAALISGVTAFLTFVALNPFMTAHPEHPTAWYPKQFAGQGVGERAYAVVAHRAKFSREMQGWFSQDALTTPGDKLAAVVTQGFGRYGPLGALRVGPAWGQDWGAWVWGPWVLSGAAWAAVRGRRQYLAGDPPVAWAVLLSASVTFAAITAFIPLAWDRYFLPIQSWSALLAACAAVEAGRVSALALAGRSKARAPNGSGPRSRAGEDSPRPSAPSSVPG